MDPQRWRRLRDLVDQYRDRPAAERNDALRAACGDEVGLFQEVQSLLESAEGAESLLGGIVSRAVTDLVADHPEGRRVGPYRILREIGRGGMGTVYLAERVDGEFEQRVALKLIRPGFDTEHFLRRFRAERQILARLQHPHIARLLDGGVADDGQPYFALEYVEGEPIDRFCEAHALTVDERLALFLDACRAVMYAHASLVVHRDLKPAHVLVTADRQVRLLDFGIARVISDEEPESPGLTQAGMRALTPEYASPEQVRGEPVGTATDVYSLGVILYELLTGTRPYEFGSRSPADVERVVCERQPDKPSTRVAAAAPASLDGFARLTGRRGPGVRRLRGDLDVICLKALQKDPARRYASVEAFAEDIHRNLTGLPVLARPDSVAYRLGKFVSRHRVGVAAAAVAIVAFAGFGGYHTTRLERERDRAQLEAARAAQVATFVRGLFEVSDPSESKGRTVTARELLDEGATRLERELEGQPEIRASMVRLIGDVYRSLGSYDEARPLLTRALDEHRQLFGTDHEEVAESAAALSTLLQDLGELAAAEPLAREALAIRRRIHRSPHEKISESLEQLAFLRETRGDVEEAAQLGREAVAMTRALFPADDPRVVDAVADFAGFLRRQQRLEEAEPLLREALAAQRARLGDLDLTVASTERNLASLLRDRGANEEADALLRQVIATRRQILGPDHPEVAIALNSHSLLLDRMGDIEGAVASAREFLRIMEGAHADRPHPDLAAGYNNFAGLLRSSGRTDEAVEMYKRAIAAVDAVLAPGHPNRAFARLGLAVTHMGQGEFTAAEPLLREALAIRRDGLAPGHRHIGDTLIELGICLTGLERFEEAEVALLEAREIFTDGPGRDDGRASRTQSRLDALYEAWGRPAPVSRSGRGTLP